jgi:S-adenosylmethionine decarboxylase
MIGLHLTMDGVADGPVDGETIEGILLELPGRIGMSILAGPFVVRGRPENPGWTGFVVIDKSHISVHTFDEGNRVSVDVFSCLPFDAEEVRSYVERKLKLTRLNVRLVTRMEAPPKDASPT